MGGAAPRFIFILRLLPPSFSPHFHHHHCALFSSFNRSPSSSSSSSSLTPKLKLKLKASQQQHIHTQPSQSPLTGTHHPWPEYSKFLSHISSAGYTSPADGFPYTGELPQAEVSACLSFARDRPNLFSCRNQAMASKLLLQKRFFRFSRQSQPSLFHSAKQTEILGFPTSSRSFCSRKSKLVDESHAPAPIDYTRVNSIDWLSPQYIAFKRNLRTMETLLTLMDLT